MEPPKCLAAELARRSMDPHCFEVIKVKPHTFPYLSEPDPPCTLARTLFYMSCLSPADPAADLPPPAWGNEGSEASREHNEKLDGRLHLVGHEPSFRSNLGIISGMISWASVHI